MNIKDVTATLSEAEKRTLESDKKKLVDLATVLQSSTTALNDYATDVAESFKEFGITKTGLLTYAKAQAKMGSVEGEVEKLNSKIEELQFLAGKSEKDSTSN